VEQLGPIHEPQVFVSLPFFWPTIQLLKHLQMVIITSHIFLYGFDTVYRVGLPPKVFLNIQYICLYHSFMSYCEIYCLLCFVLLSSVKSSSFQSSEILYPHYSGIDAEQED